MELPPHVKLPSDLETSQLSGTVFRNRSFVLLWAAQVLSQLASNMVLAGLMATVVIATGSNTANAVLILTFLVPAVAFSAIAGVLVERSDARLIMLAANLLRAGGIVLFLLVGSNVGLIFVINLLVATVTAFFVPAELTALPRLVDRRQLMAANSTFVLTINATFAIGFGFLGPLVLTTAGVNAVFILVAIMFALAALAILPLPKVPPEAHAEIGVKETGQALTAVFVQLKEGVDFVRSHRQIAWSLAYLGIAASLIAVMGAIGPGFATDILRLRPQDFFFVMGPAGLGAVIGILFLNAYGTNLPRRLLIDGGLMAMGVTLVGLALVKPITVFLSPAFQPIAHNLPEAISPIISLIAAVVVITITAGVEYAFVAIPAQTALQEDLPVEVRGRIFGILNTLLSVASFLPVLVAPVAADLLNIVFPGAGIPVVMAMLGLITLGLGIASYRRNEAAGLHRGAPPAEDDSPPESPRHDD
ncbi:MAG: MFS transporter [Chloroflexota bacterium]|nr:MFS transporter [Chloroflexota bacterium]